MVRKPTLLVSTERNDQRSKMSKVSTNGMGMREKLMTERNDSKSRRTKFSSEDPKPAQKPATKKIFQDPRPKTKLASMVNTKQEDLTRLRSIRDNPVVTKKLQDASECIPRYLFRMWKPTSGGYPFLNSTKRVVPHGFYFGIGHASVYDMTEQFFTRTARYHLSWRQSKETEFSSWTASPLFAFRYVSSHLDENPHIAIIDTEKLPNTIFHVKALRHIFNEIGGDFHWEYLAHGVVEGEAYRVVPFQELLSEGLMDQIPSLKTGVSAWMSPGQLPSKIEPLTREEVSSLGKMAKRYGTEFEVPFTVALICLKRRSPIFWKKDLSEEDVAMIGKVLREMHFPDWSGSPGVMNDGIYDTRYEDNQQMVYLMRALHAQRYGKESKGAAVRSEQSRISEELDSSFDYLSVSYNGPE